MNKVQRIILLSVLAATVILSALYYLGYVKLPEQPQAQLLPKEKTADDLVGEYREKLMSGELVAVSGEVVEIDNAALTLFAVRSGETVAGLAIEGNVIVRQVEMPGARSADAPVVAPEKFIDLGDVKPGAQVRAYVSPENKVLMMDVLAVAPADFKTVFHTYPTLVIEGAIKRIDIDAIFIETISVSVTSEKTEERIVLQKETSIKALAYDPEAVAKEGTKEMAIDIGDLRIGDRILVTKEGDRAVTILKL